jgi:hypothetical protein
MTLVLVAPTRPLLSLGAAMTVVMLALTRRILSLGTAPSDK